MRDGPQRQLIFEVERVQTVRRRVSAQAAFCSECSAEADFVELSDLARTFEVSIAEAVLQLRERCVHMHHSSSDSILVCTASLLQRSCADNPMLTKSLPPSSTDPHHTSTSE